MGSSCCGKPSGLTDLTATPEQHGRHDRHEHGHGQHQQSHSDTHDNHLQDKCDADQDYRHNHDHDEDHRCCDGGERDSLAAVSTCCASHEQCDEKCIETVAAYACIADCDGDPHNQTHRHDHDENGHKSDSACPSHLKAAFTQYSSYLEQMRCICRNALSGTAPAGFCCGKKTSRTETKTKDACCSGKGCSDDESNGNLKTASELSGVANERGDSQKAGNIEMVDFVVSGMDCTSCVDKLTAIFNSMPGVSSPRVNFVVGSGKVDIDMSVTNADQVLRFASTASNFSLVKVVGVDFYLDVHTSPSEAKRMVNDPPSQVADAQRLDKKTIRLAYDPTTIGARDLFDSLQDRCTGLAEPSSNPQLENSRRRLWDQLYKTLLAAIFTIPVAVISFSPTLVEKRTKGIISLILGTFVQMIAVPEFYRPALSALWYSRIVEMDMLVVMSITAAYGYSVIAFGFEIAGKPIEESAFFETSTMLITLILMGRLIAAFARMQAVKSVSLRSKSNSTAMLVTPQGCQDIDSRLLQFGDEFKVLPHSRVPTDGIVVSGTTEVDESMLTGESIPVRKEEGDCLIAGTVNGEGTIIAQLTRLPGKNTVTDIAQLVEEAANSKPKMQDLASMVAGWFVPAMAVIAVLVLVIWLVLGFRLLDYNSGKSIGNAIAYTVATLAVACPCALGLAVPMVLVVAGGIAAKGGVIIKSAETTEGARKVTDIVFDKTGTITEDDLAVVEQVQLGSVSESDAVALTKAVVAGGKHPVSAAVEKHLTWYSHGAALRVSDVRIVPGLGIEASCQGAAIRAGNALWTGTSGAPEVIRLQQAGLTTLVVVSDGEPLIVFGLRTRLRPEAVSVIKELKTRGIAVHLVSGDQPLAVQAVAAAVGISTENVVGQSTPPEKKDYVASLMEDPSKYVMFCGDGTNDAVAVAQANVGAQMGGGKTSSDVTQGAADVVLMNGLEGIPFLLNVSKVAFHRMMFNFVWSAVYNVLAVSMASGAWVKFRIEPKYAGAGEMVSVVPVILASLSMLLLSLRQQKQMS